MSFPRSDLLVIEAEVAQVEANERGDELKSKPLQTLLVGPVKLEQLVTHRVQLLKPTAKYGYTVS